MYGSGGRRHLLHFFLLPLLPNKMQPNAKIENLIWFYVMRSLSNADTFGEFIKEVYMYISRPEAKELWDEHVDSHKV